MCYVSFIQKHAVPIILITSSVRICTYLLQNSIYVPSCLNFRVLYKRLSIHIVMELQSHKLHIIRSKRFYLIVEPKATKIGGALD